MEASPFNLAQIAVESGIAALEFQPETASTNDWALGLASDQDRRWPLLVLTARQTGGRGRGVNRWWSADGALTFSLVVDAAAWHLPADRWPQIALVTGLAVCESLHEVYPPGIFGLKWPNDVYLGRRKLCGILVEAPSHRGRVVIGVGINVNNSFAAAPPERRETATSLSDSAAAEFDLNETLIAVLQQLLRRLAALSLSHPHSHSQDFSRYCLLTGRNVRVDTGRETLLGRCLGIDASGALLLQTPLGQQVLHTGTVVSWE